MDRDSNRKLLVRSGLLFGVGLGGFVDGIVLHQILQWHHFVSDVDRYPTTTLGGLETNTLWDGLFHAATWFAVLAGLLLLWKATRMPHDPWSTKLLAGLLLMGWGAFNLVDGTVNHYLLSIHHIRQDSSNKGAWDLAFMVGGAALLTGGWLLARRGEAEQDATIDQASSGRFGAVAQVSSALLAVVPMHVLGDGAHVMDIVLDAGAMIMMAAGLALFVSGRAGRRDATVATDSEHHGIRTHTVDLETSE